MGKSTDSAVSEFMSRDLLYVFDDQEVAEVVRNMAEQQIRRMPVADRDKRLVGIVSLCDFSTAGDPSTAGVALEQISG